MRAVRRDHQEARVARARAARRRSGAPSTSTYASRRPYLSRGSASSSSVTRRPSEPRLRVRRSLRGPKHCTGLRGSTSLGRVDAEEPDRLARAVGERDDDGVAVDVVGRRLRGWRPWRGRRRTNPTRRSRAGRPPRSPTPARSGRPRATARERAMRANASASIRASDRRSPLGFFGHARPAPAAFLIVLRRRRDRRRHRPRLHRRAPTSADARTNRSTRSVGRRGTARSTPATALLAAANDAVQGTPGSGRRRSSRRSTRRSRTG